MRRLAMKSCMIGVALFLCFGCARVLAQTGGEGESTVGKTIREAMTEVVDASSGSDPAEADAAAESNRRESGVTERH
jgi:hypothetical protein